MSGSRITELRETANEAVVAGMYLDLAEGNGEALLATLSPQIRWTVTAGLPYGGTYVGPDAVASNVFARFTTEWVDFAVIPDELFGVRDVVLALGHYVGQRRETGKAMRARFVHVWRMEGRVPVEFETIADTHTMVAAMS
ncbi:nuclear transport factor 2 family protein [Nocardia sp. bgisy134]|uniref:nuclear transport factor 2 family protein n=1 Tax=Nocardia sp. bgisy134 TaxID=3413789 RepID=UPI003D727308